MGYSAVKYGCMAIYIAAGFLVGSTIARHLITRVSSNTCLMIGVVGLFVAGLALTITGYLHVLIQSAIMLPMFVVMLSVGVAYSSASMGAISPFANKAGSAASLLGCLTVLGAACFSILISGFHVTTQLPMGVIITLISLFGFSVLTFLNYRQTQSKFTF